MTRTHSLCESVHAHGRSPWHIRPNAGPLKLGGGIDTGSLCGRVKQGWDLSSPVESFVTRRTAHDFICKDCVDVWRAALPSSTESTK